MADTGKQHPLGVNVLGEYLLNRGIRINPIAASYMGSSSSNNSYTFGRLVDDTVLRLLTLAINDAYRRGEPDAGSDEGLVPTVTNSTYEKLINISGLPGRRIYALGNSKPPTYRIEDSSGIWTTVASQELGRQAPANTGYPYRGETPGGIDDRPFENYAQGASWLPYNLSNPNNSITQWGYIRLHALQAYNEFRWNSWTDIGFNLGFPKSTPDYNEFLGSYMSAASWVESTNQAILAVHNSQNFMRGMYTSIDDLITAEISGVNSAFADFGDELNTLGNAIDFSMLDSFGLPSTLLKTLAKNNAITSELSLALLASGLTNKQISDIISEKLTGLTLAQEQAIYGAFLVIRGDRSQSTNSNLAEILDRLGVERTRIKSSFYRDGFESLADLLNVRKLFSYAGRTWSSLTVPIYSTNLNQPAKIIYPIFNSSGGINRNLTLPSVREAVGTLIPGDQPPTRERAEPNPADLNTNLPTGFDSYLRGILPEDQAIAAGAFAYSMRQIKNIENCTLPEFGRIVRNLETTNMGILSLGSLPRVGTAATVEPATSQSSTDCPEYWYAKSIDDVVVLDEDTLVFTNYRYSTGSSAPTGGPVDPLANIRMSTIKAGDRLTMNDPRSGNTVPFTVVSNTFTPNVYPAGRGVISGRFDSLADAYAVFPQGRIDSGDPNRIGPLCKLPTNEPALLSEPPPQTAQLDSLVPTNSRASANAKRILAQGSGPYNTYTMSDLFGSMSGLPYAWRSIYRLIDDLTTPALQRIYSEMFLGATWESPSLNVNQTNEWITTQEYIAPTTTANDPNPDYQPDPDEPDYDPFPYINPVWPDPAGNNKTYSEFRYATPGQPRISRARTLLIFNPPDGGGYGRGDAPPPEVDVFVRDPSVPGDCGGAIKTENFVVTDPSNPPGYGTEEIADYSTPDKPNLTIGTNSFSAGSDGRGSYGRIQWQRITYTERQWITNVVQDNWEDLTDQDTLDNPPNTPPGEPRSREWVDQNLPIVAFRVENPPVETTNILPNGRVEEEISNTQGAIYSRRGECTGPAPAGISGAGETPQEGWPGPMNSVLNSYIDQANREIARIFTNGDFYDVKSLNNAWDQLGRGLTREQRTRYIALGAVDLPRDYFVNPYPNTQITFVDSIPDFSTDTRPHMNAQTLEAISDTDSLGGQSVIGMMRAERNKARLEIIGIPVEDNLSSELTETDFQRVMINGSIPGIENGVPGPGENEEGTWTPPAWPENDDPAQPGRPIIIAPRYRYTPPTDPLDPIEIETIGPQPGNISPPFPNPGPVDPGLPWPGFPGPLIPTEPVDPDDGEPVDPVDPIEPEDPIVPPPIDTRYTSGILMPSVATISQAIDQVIECNCDCWLE